MFSKVRQGFRAAGRVFAGTKKVLHNRHTSIALPKLNRQPHTGGTHSIAGRARRIDKRGTLKARLKTQMQKVRKFVTEAHKAHQAKMTKPDPRGEEVYTHPLANQLRNHVQQEGQIGAHGTGAGTGTKILEQATTNDGTFRASGNGSYDGDGFYIAGEAHAASYMPPNGYFLEVGTTAPVHDNANYGTSYIPAGSTVHLLNAWRANPDHTNWIRPWPHRAMKEAIVEAKMKVYGKKEKRDDWAYRHLAAQALTSIKRYLDIRAEKRSRLGISD